MIVGSQLLQCEKEHIATLAGVLELKWFLLVYISKTNYTFFGPFYTFLQKRVICRALRIKVKLILSTLVPH